MIIKQKIESYLGCFGSLGNVQFHRSDVNLPSYLLALYELSAAKILDVRVVFASLKPEVPEPNLAEIKNHFRILRDAYKAQIILVFENRTIKPLPTLAKNGVPYIYIDHEIFLPFLLTKISSRQTPVVRPAVQKLSSWSQAIIIKQILSENVDGKTLTELSREYKAPSSPLNRAIKDLESLDLCEIEQIGTRKILRFEPRLTLWKISFQYLTSPIQATVNVETFPKGFSKILGGTSALAAKTSLAEVGSVRYAIDRRLFQKADRSPMAYDQELSIILELWERNPTLTQFDGCADPISIYLSLLHTSDERVAMARDEYLSLFKLLPVKLEG